jgi:hypothetical protein
VLFRVSFPKNVFNYEIQERKRRRRSTLTKQPKQLKLTVIPGSAAKHFWLKEAEAQKCVALAEEADERKRVVQERKQHEKSDR